MDPMNRQTQIYTFAPNPPLRFQSGDIFGLWEGRTNDRLVRDVDNINQNLTGGFSLKARDGPMTEVATDYLQQTQLGTPLVAVQTGISCVIFLITLVSITEYKTFDDRHDPD